MQDLSGRCAALVTAMAVVAAAAWGGAAPAAPVVAGFDRFARGAGDAAAEIEGGLLLLGELGCVNCHAPAAAAARHVAAKSGPILDRVGERIDPAWIARYLADPPAVRPAGTMPHLLAGAGEAERRSAATALAHFLASTGDFSRGPPPGARDARPREGTAIYDRVGCRACHGGRGPGAVRLPDHRPLGDLAEKWSPAALDAFLADPLHTRPSSRMPAFPLDEGSRRHLVAALLLPEARWGGSPPATVAFAGRMWEKQVDRLPDFSALGPPAKEGPVQGFDVEGFAGRNDGFCVRLEGFLHAPVAGTWRFDLASDDGSRLIVGTTRVVDADGVHPHGGGGGQIDLAAGIHPIAIEFFEAAGQCSLELDVTPPDQPRLSALDLVTPTRDGTPAAASRPPAPPAFVADAELVAQGRREFAARGCAACHRLEGAEPRGAASRGLETLGGSNAGCIAAEPVAGLPHYPLDGEQRRAIVAATRFLAAPEAREAPPRERAIGRALAALNCAACHARDGRGGVLPAVAAVDDDGEPILRDAARDALFTGPLPEMGDEGRLPPTLDGVGDKLRPEFLEEVLAVGGVDRRATMHTLMPRWHGDVARPLAALLAADPHTEAPLPALAGHGAAAVTDAGRELAGSKGLGCIKCHAFGGDRGQGLGAIDMTRFPKRLRHEWYLAYVADPQAFRPGTRMPAAWPEGKVFFPALLDGDAAGQIEAVWRYVSLEAPRPPLGLGNDPIELVATDRPVIYRNFIEGAGARAIGVGFPERANIAWDAEAFRLALAWRGSFIDARRHWSGRGEGFQPPMGDGVVAPDAAACVAVLPSPAAPWPQRPPRSRGGRFGGYALDEAGRPAFRWRIEAEGLEVEESVVAAAGPALRRTVTLRAVPEGAMFRAALGRAIEAEADGWWRVDGAWRVRVGGPGAGEPVVIGADGARELRVPLEAAADGRATVEEELAW